MRRLRWGILGTARINRRLVPALRASARNELSAIASRAAARAEAYAAEWQIPRACASYAALLADPEIDVVYIPLPNHLHAEWTIRAVEAGKHVLCEKPLALSVAEVDAVAQAASRAGVVVVEAFMYRSHPHTQQVLELIERGAIGDLHLVHGSFSFVLDRPQDVRWEPSMGGGSLWDVGCYPVSYARLLTGEEPCEVVGWQVLTPSGVDESFVGQLRFPGGALAQFDCGFRTQFRASLEVAGSEGVIQLPRAFLIGEREALVLRKGDETTTMTIEGPNPYTAEVDDLAAAILEGEAPRVSLADSRGNVAALVALRQSAHEGRIVKVSATGGA